MSTTKERLLNDLETLRHQLAEIEAYDVPEADNAPILEDIPTLHADNIPLLGDTVPAKRQDVIEAHRSVMAQINAEIEQIEQTGADTNIGAPETNSKPDTTIDTAIIEPSTEIESNIDIDEASVAESSSEENKQGVTASRSSDAHQASELVGFQKELNLQKEINKDTVGSSANGHNTESFGSTRITSPDPNNVETSALDMNSSEINSSEINNPKINSSDQSSSSDEIDSSIDSSELALTLVIPPEHTEIKSLEPATTPTDNNEQEQEPIKQEASSPQNTDDDEPMGKVESIMLNTTTPPPHQPSTNAGEENPFLPQHLRERLNQSKSSLLEEIARSSESLDASTALLKNVARHPKRKEASLQSQLDTADFTDDASISGVIDGMVAKYLPLIEADLRQRLHVTIRKQIEEPQNKTLDPAL